MAACGGEEQNPPALPAAQVSREGSPSIAELLGVSFRPWA
jgi:hypothetical protein